MKILVVCGAGRVYGKEVVTLSLIEGLTKQGHEVSCITSSWNDGEFKKRLAALSVPFRVLPLGFISKTLSFSAVRMTLVQVLRLPELWWGYRRALRTLQPDIVLHSNFHHLSLVWPMFGKEINVFHVHDVFPATAFHQRLFKLFSRKVKAFIGVSGYVARALLELGVPQNQVRTVLNGISIDTAECSTSGAALPRNGSLRIGIVGQVEEWKGHEDLVDALHILESKGQVVSCSIFGTGSSEFATHLRTKIQEYGLDRRVEWLGFVDGRGSIYQQIDVCVMPSRISEGFGMVAAEALMHGVPVIASRKGALPEVVTDEVTGYLVEARSAEEIAEKLLRLSNSGQMRDDMGRNAKVHAQAYLGAQRMITQIEGVFRQLLQQATYAA